MVHWSIYSTQSTSSEGRGGLSRWSPSNMMANNTVYIIIIWYHYRHHCHHIDIKSENKILRRYLVQTRAQYEYVYHCCQAFLETRLTSVTMIIVMIIVKSMIIIIYRWYCCLAISHQSPFLYIFSLLRPAHLIWSYPWYLNYRQLGNDLIFAGWKSSPWQTETPLRRFFVNVIFVPKFCTYSNQIFASEHLLIFVCLNCKYLGCKHCKKLWYCAKMPFSKKTTTSLFISLFSTESQRDTTPHPPEEPIRRSFELHSK